MDSDRDGRVTAVEIQSMLQQLGISLREDIVLNLVRQASQSGKIAHFFRFESFYLCRSAWLSVRLEYEFFNCSFLAGENCSLQRITADVREKPN